MLYQELSGLESAEELEESDEVGCLREVTSNKVQGYV